jgi:hypothetical protein
MAVKTMNLSKFSLMVFLAVMAMMFVPSGSFASSLDDDPIEKLRKALQASGVASQKRDKAISEAVSEISNPLECWKAASLGDWREFNPDGSVAAGDRDARAKLLLKFREGLTKAFQTNSQEENDSILELVMSICKEERQGAGQKPFSSTCAEVISQSFWKGDVDVRVARIRAYGILCPEIQEGLKVFSSLENDSEIRIRRASMDGLSYWMEAVGPAKESKDSTSVSRLKNQAILCAAVLPITDKSLSDKSPEIRKRAVAQVMISCLCLVALISDPNGKVPLDAIDTRALDIKEERTAASKLGLVIESMKPKITGLLRDSDMETRLHAHEVVEAMALGRKAWKSQAVAQNEKFSIELTAIPKELAVSLADSNYRVRRIAMDTLELLGADSIQVTPRIITALDDSDRFVRWAAIRALGEMGPSVREEALPKLTQMLQDQDGDVRKAAAQAVARLKLK